MEKQKLIQDMLLREIALYLGDLGFRASIRQQAFYKKMAFGKYSFHLAFMPHQSDIDISADVAIRFDALEDLVHEVVKTPFLNPRKMENSFSFGANLGHISGEGQIRWTILNESDVTEVSKRILEKFVNVGLPYLKRYSDLDTVFGVLSTVSPEANLLNGFPEKRAMNAVALAYLRGDKHEFRIVSDRMTDYIASIPNTDPEAFMNFVKELDLRFSGQALLSGRN